MSLEIVNNLTRKKLYDLIQEGYNKNTYTNDGYMYLPSKLEALKQKGLLFIQSTGGVSGGSCWDSSDPQYYSEDTITLQEFELYKELTKHFNMYYVQFLRDEYTQYEYYGNRTDFDYYYISWEDLFNSVIPAEPVKLGI